MHNANPGSLQPNMANRHGGVASCMNILNYWKRITIISLVMLLATLATPLMATGEDSATITVTAVPEVSGGIENFLITYVSENQLDLSWTLTGDAANIMIRAKYGEYPDDIPNPTTEPDDGFLLYYGSGSETSYYFDETLSDLYIKAWAQKNDDSWYMDTETGTRLSGMLLIVIVALALGFTISGYALKRGVLAWSASGSWLLVAVYCYTNYSTAWDIYYCFLWISVGLSIASIFSALTGKDTSGDIGEDEEDEFPELTEAANEMETARKQFARFRTLVNREGEGNIRRKREPESRFSRTGDLR